MRKRYIVARERKFIGSLSNAFSEVRAWKVTTFMVAALAAVLAFALVLSASEKPVVLVPAGFAESHGRVTVSPSTGRASPGYLSQIALGDLSLALDWQPDDVVTQYRRFLNRLTNSEYAAENIALMSEAHRDQANDVSQSFYPNRVFVNLPKLTVKVSGVLSRWEGGKQVMHSPVEYKVSYSNEGGYLHVSSLKITQ
ncbi:MAG: TraE/TraK family type IV conjugative transfer system protein [Steroidobacteraceae bacterium]